MTENAPKRKTLKGTVISAKMSKTAVVLVKRYVKHKKYGKYMTKTKKYKAHIEGVMPVVGDVVNIESCRPLSKDKHFRIIPKSPVLISNA